MDWVGVDGDEEDRRNKAKLYAKGADAKERFRDHGTSLITFIISY